MVDAVWTPAMVALLAERWADFSVSASKIADEIWRRHHVVVTRNAVIGKAHRLGLPRRPARNAHEVEAERVQPKPKEWVVRELMPAEPMRQGDPALPPAPGRYTLADLGNASCRWIEGGFYCGLPIVKGRYCQCHAEQSYVEPKPASSAARRRGTYR